MKHLNNLDLCTYELQNAVLQNLATDPSSSSTVLKAGQFFFNTANSVMKIYSGSAFKSVAYSEDVIAKSILTTKGDLIYASAEGTPASLGLGTAGQVLKVVNGLPAWAAEYSYTLPLATSSARGGIKIGFTTSATDRNYAVQLSNEKAYVNVPWVAYESLSAESGGTNVSLVTTGEKYTWNAKQNAIADVADTASGYVQTVSQTNGKISVGHKAFATPTVTWTEGNTSGPTLSVKTDGGTSTAVAIPSASASASGVVTTGPQTFAGAKTFSGVITASAGMKIAASQKLQMNGGSADSGNSNIVPYMEYDATNHAIHFSCAIYSDQEVTAGGIGSGSGGSGKITTCNTSSALSYTLSAFDDTKTNDTFNAYTINYLAHRITDLESGSATSITVTGSGNAVTGVSKSGTTITFTKGSTFLTSGSRGVANGVASLDSSTKVPLSQLPDVILGQLVYGGTVNASGVASISTNVKSKLGITDSTIQLVDSATDDTSTTPKKYGFKSLEGVYFIMEADSSFAELGLLTGDWLISIGSDWKKIDNTDAVTSVCGQTGAVTTAQVATALTNAGYKLTDTDVRNTAGATSSTAKMYLVGATDTGTYAQTYVNTSVYATNGDLHATKFNSYTLAAACAKGVDTSISVGTSSTNLPTSAAVATFASGSYHSYSISGSSVTTYTTTTNFTTQNLVAALYDSSNNLVMTDIQIVSSTVSSATVYNIKVIFAEAIGSNTYRLVVIGY